MSQDKEKLSQLMDGEVHHDILDKLIVDSELKQQWQRYHLIRDTLSGNSIDNKDVSLSSLDFVNKVSASLESEPTILAPKRNMHRQSWVRQLSGLAIAATVATVAIISVKQPAETTGISTGSGDIAQVQQVVPGNSIPVNQLYVPVASGVLPSQVQGKPLNSEAQSRLNYYLVNHNEYSVTAQMQGMLPYMRIISVTPSEVIVISPEHEK